MTDIAHSPPALAHGEAATARLSTRLSGLPAIDRRLLLAFVGVSLLPLVLGLGFGLMTALARGGLIGFEPETAYRVLTLHGTSAFFWWLYLAQVALMIGLAAGESADGLKARPLILAGLVVLLAGLALSEGTAFTRTPLLYDGNPDLGREDAEAVADFVAKYAGSKATSPTSPDNPPAASGGEESSNGEGGK